MVLLCCLWIPAHQKQTTHSCILASIFTYVAMMIIMVPEVRFMRNHSPKHHYQFFFTEFCICILFHIIRLHIQQYPNNGRCIHNIMFSLTEWTQYVVRYSKHNDFLLFILYITRTYNRILFYWRTAVSLRTVTFRNRKLPLWQLTVI